MRRIKLKKNDPHREYRDDINRIVNAMAEAGFMCTDTEAKELWEEYSDSFAAGWLGLPSTNEEIVGCVSPYFDPVEPDSDEY